MPNRLKGASSGDGGDGGLTLGPATNTFNAATESAAETARDTYAVANAAWLAQYDADPTFTIIITYGSTTLYQARRSSAWVNVTGLVRGPAGTNGADACSRCSRCNGVGWCSR